MKDLDELILLVRSLKSDNEMYELLNELFTKSELEALAKRWKILKLLFDKVPQRAISEDLSVSLCKVTRGSKIIKNKDSIVTKFLIAHTK